MAAKLEWRRLRNAKKQIAWDIDFHESCRNAIAELKERARIREKAAYAATIGTKVRK